MATRLATACAGADPAVEATSQAREELVRGTPAAASDVPSVGRPYVVMVLFETYDPLIDVALNCLYPPSP